MSDNRSTLTLGGRIYIWPAFIEHIKNNPHGLGLAFGIKALPVENFAFRNNSHNVFLNHMLHLSIPVGILFTLFFLVIIIFSFIKNFSFLTLGIWIAFLVPMCMDYTLFVSETPFFLFVIYCIFFRKDRPKKALS